MAKKASDNPTANGSAKTVSLTFSSEAELAAYEKFLTAAKEDDRSVNSLLVRILIGKEHNPAIVYAATSGSAGL